MIGMRRTISQPGWSRWKRKAVSAGASARVRVGARDQDEVRRLAGAGDEPLAAGDAPAVALRARRWCGSSPGSEPPPGAGSVIAKARAHRPSTIGCSQRVLLLRRCRAGEQDHVAVVGRRAVEGDRAEDRAVRLLVDHRPGDDRQAHAAARRGVCGAQRPAALAFARSGSSASRRCSRVRPRPRSASTGRTCGVDEGAHPQAQVLDLGREGEAEGRPRLSVRQSRPLRLRSASSQAVSGW